MGRRAAVLARVGGLLLFLGTFEAVALKQGALGPKAAPAKEPAREVEPERAVQPPGWLKASGRDIVDESGKPVLLRGVNLGGWLVPEGYLLKLEGKVDRPRRIFKMVAELAGEGFEKEFRAGYRKNYVSEADIRAVARAGFDHVRIPFNANLFLSEDDPPEWKDEGFEVLDQLIGWCRSQGLHVLLDMHCAPGGQTGTNIDDDVNDKPELWTEESHRRHAVEIWAKIAERYKDEPVVLGYDLLNEPIAPDFSKYESMLVPFYRDAIAAIRKVDERHMIFLEGANWANNFKSFTEPLDPNVVYSFHKYWNENSPGSIKGYLDLGGRLNAPLYCGEFGENSNEWFADCTRLLEDFKVSWGFWPWKKVDSASGVYSVRMPKNYGAIVRFTQGGEKPDEETARAALQALVENLRIAKCAYNAGVVQSLLKALPRTIEAEELGYLGEGVSYHDAEKANQGRALRPGEGVDIEVINYAIGWIENGEWLIYEISSPEARDYDFKARVASAGGSGKFRLEIDGQDVTGPIAVEKTGGWKDWKIITRKGVPVPAGRHRLKLFVIEGGFNLDWLRFDLATSN